MGERDEASGGGSTRRKILKPYRHLFGKPIAVKRTVAPPPADDACAPDDGKCTTYHSATQTSRTILELAHFDDGGGGVRERSISPDSLCASPPLRQRREGVRARGEAEGDGGASSETDTIVLVKKESAFDLRRINGGTSQLEDIPAPVDYFDDLDEYTPDGSVHINNTIHDNTAQYNHTSTINQPPLHSNMAAKCHTAVYPPLYGHPAYNVRAGNTNHGDSVPVAHAPQPLVAAPVLPDAHPYLVQQQQQLDHTIADSIFGGNSLLNTFLAKSKNRSRYTGDQADYRTKKRGEMLNRQPNSHSLKSVSYVDCTSSPPGQHQHQQQRHQSPPAPAPHTYPNRTRFTLNECAGQPLHYQDHYRHPHPHHHHQHQQSSNNCYVTSGGDPIAMDDEDGDGTPLNGTYAGLPKVTTVSGSRTAVAQRRSNSFMMPTIASERRSCMHEVQQISGLLSPTIRGCSLSPRSNTTNNMSQLFGAQSVQHCQQMAPQYQQQQQHFYQYQQQMHQLHKRIHSHHEIKVPYIDGSVCDDNPIGEQRNKIYKEKIRDYSPVNIRPVTPKITFEEDLLRIDQLSLDVKNSQDGNSTARNSTSATSIDSTINNVLSRVKHDDWNVALKGLAEVTELCRSTDATVMAPHMTVVNQRLLDLLRSPRSHVCRTACQAAGHLFESMKDTRKPEFEDIVNILLHKTADSNKFIRQDANLALDCMVTHISSFHAIKALCSKGPTHKNPLVRCATIRLIICAVVIAGPEAILNPANSDYTRKRVIVHLAKFITDKNLDTRKYAERLFKVLNRERSFDVCVKKFLEREDLELFKQNIRYLKK